jgi:uncharacterized protein (UPF0332 family)
MNFDWSGYLALAKEMITKANEFADQEAVYRSVVSRAYYGVYCLARNRVRDIDAKEFHGNDHKALQNYLTEHPHKNRKKLGNQLRSLHQHRIKADYSDELDEQAVNKANRAINLAQKITEGLVDLFS